MIDRTEAEDHLRVIRSLMEKATIYRALSAPAALAGGLLSIGGALLVPWLERKGIGTVAHNFAIVWSAVFLITSIASLILIQQDAARRGEPFLSHGARSAFRAMLPSMGLAGCYSLVSFYHDAGPACAPWWLGFYGLALLAMTHFAPRSIVILGWSFLISGILAICSFAGKTPVSSDGPSVILGATFGLFHLVYAAGTWPRRKA